MNNEYERAISEARIDYNRIGGIEAINGSIPVPWRTKKDMAIWLLYLAYIFPHRASKMQYTHEFIANLVKEEWDMSPATYYNYLKVIKDRGWLVPSQVMTQWEQTCYLNGPQWQQQREEECRHG